MACPAAHDAVDELDRGLLLETKTFADAVAGIDQDREAQWQIGFRDELQNLLRLLFLRNLEIFLLQIGDETALLVRDGKQHVHAVYIERDARVGVDGADLRRDLLVLGRHGYNKGAKNAEDHNNFFIAGSSSLHYATIPSSQGAVEPPARLALPVDGLVNPIRQACRKKRPDSAAAAPYSVSPATGWPMLAM